MKHFLTAIIIIFILSSVIYSQESSQVVLKKNSFGVGLGIPYGWLGGNIDVNVAPNLNVSAGIGTTILAGIAINFGFKYFIIPVERTFRPRVAAYYGVNGANFDDNENFSGVNLGVGFQLMWGKTKSNGLDFDIIFIATSSIYDEEEVEENTGNVGISLGYRHGF